MPLLEEHYYGTGVAVASEFGVEALSEEAVRRQYLAACGRGRRGTGG